MDFWKSISLKDEFDLLNYGLCFVQVCGQVIIYHHRLIYCLLIQEGRIIQSYQLILSCFSQLKFYPMVKAGLETNRIGFEIYFLIYARPLSSPLCIRCLKHPEHSASPSTHIVVSTQSCCLLLRKTSIGSNLFALRWIASAPRKATDRASNHCMRLPILQRCMRPLCKEITTLCIGLSTRET